MNTRPPVLPLRQALPFGDPAFTWQTFEAFFCDFLNARPVFSISGDGREIRGEIIRARPFGRPGDVQHGIDLLADLVGGDIWDFQCKQVKTWSPEQTRKAILAYQRDAARRCLLVTCDVSEECQRVISDYPGWTLWDAREINRRFRESGALKGAPILFTHFGPGWGEAFFGVSGSSPLIAAEAKFQQQLREGVRFHHRHALIGRKTLLQQLDDFAENDQARVFLLVGRGGLGKSRLLLEWSREFQEKHPSRTLRFIFDKNVDFGPALRVAPEPLVLVFDDAHRLDEVRRALFPELALHRNVKLVLSLRPGPVGQVMQELVGTGLDTVEILPPTTMPPLNSEQAMELVDVALKPQFFRAREYLRAASRDCPLVAVIGAELINSGALVESDLRVTEDVRTRVFASMLDDARWVRTEFGAQQTDDFLRLVALLGPVKLDAAFLEKAAPFLGIASADRVSRLRDALEATGLLLTSGAGTRITPDLLSDHLAYDACYDVTGQSRIFAERLLGGFSPGEFPKLIQHLAEAEWRALSEKPGAASVVEPLWRWFCERFERSTFYERQNQVQEWGNIAHLQPERTMQLAELALSLTTAPEPTIDFLRGDRWNTHEYSLEWLPKMLGTVAEHHAEFVARCFDILWRLGKGRPVSDFRNNQSHPVAVMSDVMRLRLWKNIDVLDAALDWIDRLLAGDEWLQSANSPATLFQAFFHPIFATSIEVNWSSGRTFHFGSVPVHLKNTERLRERVRLMWQALLSRKNPHLASELIPTLEQACDIARNGIGGVVSEEFRVAWEAERLRSFAAFRQVVIDFPEPLIQFQIRRALMRDLRYGKESLEYRDACRNLLACLPDTLDLRIARAAFGTYYDEFERYAEKQDWQIVAKAKWESFTGNVAEETHAAFPNGAWFDHFAELDGRWREFRTFQPNFRPLLVHIAGRNPHEGLVACDDLLKSANYPLVDTFDAIAMSATKTDADQRLRFVRKAAESENEMLCAGAVTCCSWWRREGNMPEEAWQILETLAPHATATVADRMTTFLWWNEDTAAMRDWNLVAALPFAPDQLTLASSIAARAADLVTERKLRPSPESVTQFLGRFECLESATGYEIENALAKLAEAFPVAVFLMLWRRNEARKAGNSAIKSLPYDFARIPFRDIMNAPEIIDIVSGVEHRALAGEELDFDEVRLLRSAIQHGKNASGWLEAAVQKANTEEHLHFLRRLGSVGEEENAALAYPEFAKALLLAARRISHAFHGEMFRKLLHLSGARGSTGSEPDDEWKTLLESIERLAHQHAADPELGPLFSEIVKNQRDWIDSMRRQSFADDED